MTDSRKGESYLFSPVIILHFLKKYQFRWPDAFYCIPCWFHIWPTKRRMFSLRIKCEGSRLVIAFKNTQNLIVWCNCICFLLLLHPLCLANLSWHWI